MGKKINRRQFVKNSIAGTVGVIGLPSVLPSGLFPGKNRIMPNDRINLGFIGVGGMGTGHLRSFLGYEDVRVVAVCDVKKVQRDNAKSIVDERYGDDKCSAYNDFSDLGQKRC